MSRILTNVLLVLVLAVACNSRHGVRRHHPAALDSASQALSSAGAPAAAATQLAARSTAPERIERKGRAMGTTLDFIVYTNDAVDLEQAHAAIDRAIQEIERLEGELSEWRPSSDVSRINESEGKWVSVSRETLDVIEKAQSVARASGGAFDITFHTMGDLWKFGSAQGQNPVPPPEDEVRKRRALIDFRRVDIDAKSGRVRIANGRKIGLGGIAKGYIVDRAVATLRGAGLHSFVVQAGGDLYAAGHKPDGLKWSTSIQDPRAPEGDGFATLELEDRALCTAGDYARAYVYQSKRYHHIIDPRTGYPAVASRSVSIDAPDALTADMLDDAVFVLGPERGLELVDRFEGVAAVIVDARNQVFVSPLLAGKVAIHRQPTEGL